MRPLRHAAAAALIAAAVALAVPATVLTATSAAGAPASGVTTTAPTESPTTTGSPTEPVGLTDLSGAVLAWELNNESNNKAFAPGTFNFLSAGRTSDPGRGGQNLVAPGVWRGTSQRGWWARQGAAEVQKQGADGVWRRATWAGLGTARDGSPLTSTTGPFSGHRIVLSNGTGEIDREAGTLRLSWKGSFSVVYYSGYTFFTVSAPTLTVTDGIGALEATVAGYAADREDPDRWSPVPPQRVAIASFTGEEIALDAGDGLALDPDYLGVTYQPLDGTQVRSGSSWGAFPPSFLTYLERMGSASFFYSSGGAADPHKVPRPVLVSFTGDDPTGPTDGPTPTSTATPTSTPTPTTTVNPAPPTPTTTALEQPAPPPLPGQPTVSSPPTPQGAPSSPPGGDAPGVTAPGQPAAVPTVYALTGTVSSEAAPAGHQRPGGVWRWWAGSLLLLGAAALTLLTAPSRVRSSRTARTTRGPST